MLERNSNSNEELTSSVIADMTAKFLEEGNEITKIHSSKTQFNYVRNTHGCVSGRTGWFEVK